MNIFKKYKKQKRLSNLSIIGISLIIAIGVNFFVLNNINISNNLKANILEKEQKNNIGDLYMKNEKDLIILKNSKKINKIDSLSLSLIYNPENVVITDIVPKLNAEIIKTSKENGIINIILDFAENYNINPNDKILSIKYKKKNDKTENLNIINANFTDSTNNTYELSTSGIAF